MASATAVSDSPPPDPPDPLSSSLFPTPPPPPPSFCPAVRSSSFGASFPSIILTSTHKSIFSPRSIGGVYILTVTAIGGHERCFDIISHLLHHHMLCSALFLPTRSHGESRGSINSSVGSKPGIYPLLWRWSPSSAATHSASFSTLHRLSKVASLVGWKCCFHMGLITNGPLRKRLVSKQASCVEMYEKNLNLWYTRPRTKPTNRNPSPVATFGPPFERPLSRLGSRLPLARYHVSSAWQLFNPVDVFLSSMTRNRDSEFRLSLAKLDSIMKLFVNPEPIELWWINQECKSKTNIVLVARDNEGLACRASLSNANDEDIRICSVKSDSLQLIGASSNGFSASKHHGFSMASRFYTRASSVEK